MASHQTQGPANISLSAQDFQNGLFSYITLEQIYKQPTIWYHDHRLAALTCFWREMLKTPAYLSRQVTDISPGFNRVRGQYTKLFELVDVLYHWISNQHASQYQLKQDVPPENLSQACNDLGHHIPLVRFTIATLALVKFGPWLKSVTNLGPGSVDTSTYFELVHLPAGYTLQWATPRGFCRIELDLLFPQGQPIYATSKPFNSEQSIDNLQESTELAGSELPDSEDDQLNHRLLKLVREARAILADIRSAIVINHVSEDDSDDLDVPDDEDGQDNLEDDDDDDQEPAWYTDDYTVPSDVNPRWESGRLIALYRLSRSKPSTIN